MIPTVEELESYLESLEDVIQYSFSATGISDLPNLREAVNRLWVDISRYGPGIPAFPEGIPGLGDFEVPPPPATPPPPKSWIDKSSAWVEKNPWSAAGIATGVVGAGLLTGYGAFYLKNLKIQKLKAIAAERRKVIGA